VEGVTYRVAIPSYHRADRIGRLTLTTLFDGGVDMSRVDVWVASEEEARRYRGEVEAGFGANVIVHGLGPGLGRTRNAIADAYPAGTRLLQLDDDIRMIVQAVNSKNLIPLPNGALHGWIERGFALANGLLWCIYPAANPYYMAPRGYRNGGLWYAEGAWFGYTVAPENDRAHQYVYTDHAEDFERSIRFFQHDGAMCRLDMLAARTAFWTEPGGMQDTRTTDNIEAGIEYVLRTYPGMARRTVTAAGRPNLRLARPAPSGLVTLP
jgi:hypothetical protein